jgi:hypothetical protein
MRSFLFLFFLPFSLSAVDYDFKGQFRVRNQNRELTSSNGDRRNLIQLRARTSLKVSVKKGLTLTLTPQATKTYGEVQNSLLTSGDQFHSSVDIFEASVFSQEEGFSYQIGRQKLNYGDHLILGTRNWTNGGLVFDALKLSFELGRGDLDFAYAKVSEGSDIVSTNDDINLAFLYYKIIKEKDLNLDAYIIHNNDRQGDEVWALGSRYKGQKRRWGWRSEIILQSLPQTNDIEHTIDLEGSFFVKSSLRTFFGWTQSSGRYNQLYTNRHFYNGMIDIVGRRNLEGFFAGTNYKIDDRWKLNFKWMNFNQMHKGIGAYDQAVASLINGDRNNSDIGNEFDLSLHFQKNKYENLTLGLSTFLHGDYFTSSPQASRFFYLEYLFLL